MYADDVQIYLTFDPNKDSPLSVTETVQHCFESIRSWMAANKLKLNESKTDFIVLRRKRHDVDPSLDHIPIGNSIVDHSSTIRNLGVYLDQELNMQSHISSVCKSAYSNLKNIARIRKYLSESATQSLVHAFITSRIDFCNSLLYGISKQSLLKLQHIQNSAARLVKRVKKSEHITPVLFSLHWLPVSHRIKFKLLLLTFKAIHNMSPEYIRDLLHNYQPVRSLRSADSSLLDVPTCHLSTCGERSFSVAAPKLWNSLPNRLRNCSTLNSFKAELKTYLFKDAFCLSHDS